MPQIEFSVSCAVKENQKDESPAASLAKSLKDATVVSYDGAKRYEIGPGDGVTLDVSYLTGLRFLALELLTGTSVRLRLRSSQTEMTDFKVGRIFAGEILNIEKLTLVNPGTTPIVARLLLAGTSSS